MRIYNITNELPQHPVKKYNRRSIEKISQIVVHHTASNVQDPEQYARYHVDKRDWPGIAYHFMIRSDGRVYRTNDLDTLSYHAAGHNTKSIGVCLMGNFNEHEPRLPQLWAATELISTLMILLNIETVLRHGDTKATDCPGKSFPFDRLMYQVKKYRENG